MRITPVHAVLGVALLLGTVACGSDSTGEQADGTGPIAVEATDTACTVARTEAAAGTVEFTVSNKGTKVNEFYLLGEGDQVLGEVENITPGLTRTFHVQVDEPGTYTTACKPGMKGEGRRADFTVTGATTAAKHADQKLTEAVERYETYVGAALASEGALKEYIEHNGSAVFACPPGVRPGGYWGETLFS